MPAADLLARAKVRGHAGPASAAGVGDPVPGVRFSDRTGRPVSCSSSDASVNRRPLGVEKTTTSHPTAWHMVIRAGIPSGAGAPLSTRYNTPLARCCLLSSCIGTYLLRMSRQLQG